MVLLRLVHIVPFAASILAATLVKAKPCIPYPMDKASLAKLRQQPDELLDPKSDGVFTLGSPVYFTFTTWPLKMLDIRPQNGDTYVMQLNFNSQKPLMFYFNKGDFCEGTLDQRYHDFMAANLKPDSLWIYQRYG
jgi:hypothetical protein